MVRLIEARAASTPSERAQRTVPKSKIQPRLLDGVEVTRRGSKFQHRQRKRGYAWLASPTGSRSFSGADDSRSWEVAAAAAASAREDRGDVDADAPVHKSQLFAQNAIRRAPLVSIPTPPSLHPLVTQTSSDMIGAALKQELS